jgi:4-hydroxybenzoate polyprenyltransferase
MPLRVTEWIPDRKTIVLLRIPFSFYLLPVFLLSLSETTHVSPAHAVGVFLIVHFLVYPSSNGYNSYVDRDEGSIGGLETPPLPDRRLYLLTAAMDVAAILLSVFINLRFATYVCLYILASRAYSSPLTRLKKYPIGGLIVVAVFQGGMTFLMCSNGIAAPGEVSPSFPVFLTLASSFHIAAAYPLTQIYQHEEDKRQGVKSLSAWLGYQGTFIFSAMMFLCSTFMYYLHFQEKTTMVKFVLLQAFLVPVVFFFLRWWFSVNRDVRQANFENTMRMNLIGSASMTLCFTLFVFLKP